MPDPSVQTNGHAGASTDATSTAATSKVQPTDVGWQFVPQYYNFMNKSPHRLHCFYNKRSTYLHGEEGEDTQVALGQQEIHERIVAIGYNECKVYIHSIDSQSSAGGGVIILVIGEMSNDSGPWRKFTQTFFLAEQPGGYFVLNDIFRYLKEEGDDAEVEETATEEAETAEASVVEEQPEVEATPAYEPETVKAVDEVAEEATPEPEPVSAPAAPDPEVVPIEAEVAAVPDQDIAPDAPAVEVSAPAEESIPAPAPVATADAPISNGTTTPTPAPAAAPAAPAAPPKPKSWASLAAAGAQGKGAWGSALASSQVGTIIGSATSAAAAAVAPLIGKKEETAPAPAPATSGSSGSTPRHPFYENALKVQTSHCFVKLPNWSIDNQSGGETIDESTLRQVAQRFGEVTKVEIVKSKACAFVEFTKVESARKAIIASLGVNQGGEGGVTVAPGQKLNFETRKEKDERGPKRDGQAGAAGTGGQAGGAGGRRGAGPGGRGGRSGAQGREGGEIGQSNGGQNGERMTNGVSRGRGRGRGGLPGGDRLPSQTAVSK